MQLIYTEEMVKETRIKNVWLRINGDRKNEISDADGVKHVNNMLLNQVNSVAWLYDYISKVNARVISNEVHEKQRRTWVNVNIKSTTYESGEVVNEYQEL